MDDSQRTASWYAAENSNIATTQSLLDHGSNPLHEDCEGRTSLHKGATRYDNING